MSNRPALGGTVPLWGKMSHVPRRPCTGHILSRFGKKSDVCDCVPARPTCRMQSALSCICQSTKTARGGTQQRTAHVERKSTRTHVHIHCSDAKIGWYGYSHSVVPTADHFLQHRMRTSNTCSHTDTFASASVSSLELSLLLAFCKTYFRHWLWKELRV